MWDQFQGPSIADSLLYTECRKQGRSLFNSSGILTKRNANHLSLHLLKPYRT